MVMVIAFIICITLTLKYLPRDLLSPQDIYNFCLIIMGSLLVGTKLMAMVVHGDFSQAAFVGVLKFWKRGSFAFFPAFLPAVILIFLYCKLKRIPLLKAMDYLFPIAVLGVAIHRTFGCFLAGCCYGKPTNLPWGMLFANTSRAGQHFPGTPLHPTQLYYGITTFMIFAILVIYKNKKNPRQVGETTALGFMMLALSYFFITFLRGDIPGNEIYFHLSRSQYLAMVMLAAGIFLFARAKGGLMRKKIVVILILFMCLPAFGTAAGKNNTQKTREIVLSNSDLGSPANPVKCNGDKGEEEYLERLRDSSGKPVKFRRIGHAHPDPNGNILDKYEIKSKDGTARAEIYMDMNWDGYVEDQAIPGFKIKVAKKSKTITYKFETQSLTARDVYHMIIDHGFHCEIFSGSGFHGEGLNGIKIPKNSIFPLRRIIFSEKESNGNIATWSRLNIDPPAGIDRDIRLNWNPGIQKCSFENAISLVENLNRQQKGGFSGWRIPTLTELFSIVDNSERHFPGEFNLPKGETLTFWTATPVRKKGTVLDNQKSKKAYYIIKLKYNNQTNKYSLSFNFRDVEGKNRKEAYLLPLFSEITYAYQPSPTRAPTPPVSPSPGITPPGFDPQKKGPTPPSQKPKIPGLIPPQSTSPAVPKTPISPHRKKAGGKDKIPGFDDVQAPTKQIQPPVKTPPQIKPPSTPPPTKTTASDRIPGFDDVPTSMPRTVNIALIPCMWKGMLGGNEQQLLVLINDEIEKALSILKIPANISLKIDKKNPNNRTGWTQMTRVYSITLNQSFNESDKMRLFKSEIMTPQKIDIIVTVVTNFNKSNLNFNLLEPMIISGIDDKIYSGKFPQNASNRFSSLTNFVGNTIKDIVRRI